MIETSIIIRTKNEEKWLAHCLNILKNQNYKKFEIIIVDNKSTDKTLEIAENYKIKKIFSIDKFKPGMALNIGIKKSIGKYIVCLSAHCIPTNNSWLKNILSGFNSKKIAAIYGRQIPLKYTNNADKRDLMNVFGLEKKIQKKDYFFHNANSAIRKSVWMENHFDEKVNHIVDRIWAKKIISKKFQIIYEPKASVYHHHGLNHNNNNKRLEGLVKILDNINTKYKVPNFLSQNNIDIFAIIPIQNSVQMNQNKLKSLNNLIKETKKSKYIKGIFVLSDKNLKLNNIDYILRKKTLNSRISLRNLMKLSLNEIEDKGYKPYALIYLNLNYINRPSKIINKVINEFLINGLDTAFPGLEEYGDIWYLNKKMNTQTLPQKCYLVN